MNDMPAWVRVLLTAIRRAMLAFCTEIAPLCKATAERDNPQS